MSYFSFFPVTSVVIDGEKLELKQIKNILIRAKFSEYLKEKEGLFTPYRIKENDKPETLAYKFYGKSDLHWIILLLNEIIDPYFDWPLNDRALNNYISDKYLGTAVYVEDRFYHLTGPKKTQEISKREPVINGRTRARITRANGTTKELLILSFDPSLSKMIVVGDVGNNGVPNTNENTLVITNSNDNEIEAKIRYIEPNISSVHHFENEVGEWLDPRGRAFTDIAESRIRIYTSGTSRTLNLLGEVTNTEHEMRTNDLKRNINLLKPEHLNAVLDQFANLIKPKRRTQI